MEISKKALTSQLKEAARLLDVLGEDPFRAKAYQTAARGLEAFEGDFITLFQERRLTNIRGIGQSLAHELYALETQDALPILHELYEQVPEGVRSLFRVSGLGAKKVGALWRSGVENLEDLVKAVQDGRVAALKGFGEKSAAGILAGAEFALAARKRMRLDVAELLEGVVLEVLETALPEARVETAGSLRRGLETVGNLDFVVSGASPEAVANALESVADIRESGETRLNARLEGRDLTVTIAEEAAFGAVLLVGTGNETYRRMLLERAAEQGYDLKDTGLYRDGELVSTPEEKDVLQRLELPFIVPERRESTTPQPIHDLITPDDVRGLIHNHSVWSDAAFSIREMVAAARVRGYTYLAMADHSRASYYANGLSIERVYAQAQEIAEIREELKAEGSDFELLHGLEVDILSDGSLDYPDDVLDILDYTVVSVHQNFTLSEADQTERIVKAVQNPHASILGHLTGRLVLSRPGYALDHEAVIKACAEAGTVIEINANPHRLDMDWRWVVKAKERGCTFSIDPDAHHTSGFDDVYYGVLMARKAGLIPADVVNTAPTGAAFLKRLKPR